MANQNIKAPRGTQDILGDKSYEWQFVEQAALKTAGLFGFREMRTPTFEQMDLFKRSVGDTTDVVQKEMYEVRAEKGKDLYGLKPEGTAGAVRSAIENNLLKSALPLKICYLTSCFRHEKPQAGRLREFHQFGVEMFGAKAPGADVEVINIARELFALLGLEGIELYINSIGCPECRAKYHKALTDYFKSREDELCDTCKDRLEKNPMRILDCKSPVCAEIAKDAPVILDYLCEECSEHFEGVKTRLQAMNIAYKINPKIVRGLDYYTKTVFEFVSGDLGAQSTVCGGGRYDGLVEQMGGDPTPGLGFAIGLERLLLIMEAQGVKIPEPEPCTVFIASRGDKAGVEAGTLTNTLRNEGFYAECDLMERSVKAQMKYANKIGAQFTMVLGDDELAGGTAKLRDMQTGKEKEIAYRTDLVQTLYDIRIQKETDAMAEEFGDNALAEMMGMGG